MFEDRSYRSAGNSHQKLLWFLPVGILLYVRKDNRCAKMCRTNHPGMQESRGIC